MSVSEVIENYIRRHPGVPEKEAFEGFLLEDRIKTWVGGDDGRRERLRKEFGRVWGGMHVEGQVTTAARVGPAGPAGPQYTEGRGVRVQATDDSPQALQKPAQPRERPEAAQIMQPIPAMGAQSRKLAVMCTGCMRVDVWMDGGLIACRSCGKVYDDMLLLIRVTPVGPFEFLFGEGWVGYATATGIALALLALYGVLRWA